MKLDTGDIVEFKNVIVRPQNKSTFISFKSNQSLRTTMFTVSGVRGMVPFANGLIKKKFVVYTDRPSGQHNFSFNGIKRLFMLDNYKPIILGSGYEISLTSLKCVKKVGRIIDTTKLPANIRDLFYKQNVLSDCSKSILNKTGKTIKSRIEMLRRNHFMLTGVPKHIQWALYLVKDINCSHCSESLLTPLVRLYDLDTTNEKEELAATIIEVITSHYNINKHTSINVLPIAYYCSDCGRFSILVKVKTKNTNPSKFSISPSGVKTFTIDVQSKFVKDSKLIYKL